MNYLNQTDFYNLINKYNKFMNIYDLIRIYYNITDKIFPNYIHKYSNKNVFFSLYEKDYESFEKSVKRLLISYKSPKLIDKINVLKKTHMNLSNIYFEEIELRLNQSFK